MEKIKIDLYISDLLYHYDCVIVPELGGFIGNYAPAKILQAQNIFSPPSKSISFNKDLQVNDGLLANHISERKLIDYKQACEIIHEFVKNTTIGLNNGNKIVIEKVGTLYTDKDGNTRFSPDQTVNYLKESFGLESFRKTFIQRDKEENIHKKIKESIPLNAQTKDKRSKSFWPAAAAIALLAMSGLAYSIYEKPTIPYINYSNFNLFANKAAKFQLRKPTAAEEGISKKDNVWIELDNQHSELVLIDEFSEDNQLIVRTNTSANNFAALDNTLVADKEVSKKKIYHIVGGCFSIYSNAEKLQKNLSSKGFEAEILGKINGLHAVGYKSFATRTEAVEYLTSIKKAENPKAWLLIK